MSRTVAIVLAAGAGRRLAAQTGKALVALAGKPLMAWSLTIFDASPEIDELLLVVAAADRANCQNLLGSFHLAKPLTLVEGGKTRHESEFNALEALAPRIQDGFIARVLVHDAARPFPAQAVVARLLAALAQSPGAIPAMVASALLIAGSTDGRLREIVPDAWAVQTPQAFRAGILLEAHHRARTDGFQGSDTASVVERIGQGVAVLPGSPDTFKITTPVDLVRAEIVARRISSPSGGGKEQ